MRNNWVDSLVTLLVIPLPGNFNISSECCKKKKKEIQYPFIQFRKRFYDKNLYMIKKN